MADKVLQDAIEASGRPESQFKVPRRGVAQGPRSDALASAGEFVTKYSPFESTGRALKKLGGGLRLEPQDYAGATAELSAFVPSPAGAGTSSFARGFLGSAARGPFKGTVEQAMAKHALRDMGAASPAGLMRSRELLTRSAPHTNRTRLQEDVLGLTGSKQARAYSDIARIDAADTAKPRVLDDLLELRHLGRISGKKLDARRYKKKLEAGPLLSGRDRDALAIKQHLNRQMAESTPRRTIMSAIGLYDPDSSVSQYLNTNRETYLDNFISRDDPTRSRIR